MCIYYQKEIIVLKRKIHSSSQQRLVWRILVLKMKFEIPQQPINSYENRILPKLKEKKYLYSMQLFSANATISSKNF
jgi:hypothetical protein